MSSRPLTASVFLTAGAAVLGVAVWVSIAGVGRQPASLEDPIALAQEGGQTEPATSTASSIPLAELTEPESVVEPEPLVEPEAVVEPEPLVEPEPVTVSETLAAPAGVNGVHVLCPLSGGGTAHLLLTSETYYRAESAEEEAMLTERFGPAVTNVDPALLPPKSDTSVTEALSTSAG